MEHSDLVYFNGYSGWSGTYQGSLYLRKYGTCAHGLCIKLNLTTEEVPLHDKTPSGFLLKFLLGVISGVAMALRTSIQL